MYRIAICDDDEMTGTFIESTLIDFFKEIKRYHEIDIYTKGETLCSALEKNVKYDLVFLDVNLGGMNGIAVGERIRNKQKNETMQIIYITSQRQIERSLFETRPQNFLIKPCSKETLIDNMKKTISLMEDAGGVFFLKAGKAYYNIAYKEIKYFTSSARKITLVGVEKEYVFYDKLVEVMKQLPEFDFFYVHKSYIVNYTYVKEFHYDMLVLTSGEEISISQPFRKSIRERFLKRRKE